MILIFISLFFCFFSSTTTYQTEYEISSVNRLAIGDTKRLTLTTDALHSFSVNVTLNASVYSGFIFQLHSQYHNIKLSNSTKFPYDWTVSGTSVGLWNQYRTSLTSLTFYVKISCNTCNGTKSVPILSAVTTIDNEAPIPGGCNLVTAVDTDPNLQLTYTSYTTTVTFQDGNLGYNTTSGGSPGKCYNGTTSPFQQLQYTLYRKLLSIEDYNVDTLFDALEGIIHGDLEGLPTVSKDSSGPKAITFDSFAGDGTIYVVMLTSLTNHKSSVYVPAVTYSCVFDSFGVCNEYTPLINKIISPVIGLIGLFLCFLSHRLFHIEVLLFTFIILTFGLYILDTSVLSATHTVYTSLALAGGLIFTLLLFVLWFFTAWHLPFIFLFTGTSGFLIAAVLFFTPFGSITTLWTINYVYGLFVACLMVFILIPGVIFPRAMNIFSSSFVGGYLVIFAISMFVFTVLDEIVLRVAKNASVPGYLSVKEAYPFQMNDIILTCIWGFLMVSGIVVQAILAKGRDPFPQKSLFKQCKEKCKKRKPLILNASIQEHQSLLNSYCSSPSAPTVGFSYGATN